MALYITESGDVINASTIQAAERQARKQASGKVLGFADDVTKQRRLAVLSSVCSDNVLDRIAKSKGYSDYTDQRMREAENRGTLDNLYGND